MNQSRKKLRLGDLLVENHIISNQQLQEALDAQKTSGLKLGRILIGNGYVEEERLLEFLSQQLKIPYLKLSEYEVDADVVRKIPEISARRFRAVALKEDTNGILIGMSDPTNIFAYDELARLLELPLQLAVVKESEILETIDSVYRRTSEISDLAEELDTELSASDFDVDALLEGADVTDAPVVKLIQSIFEDAIQMSASDIHIEPDDKVLRIRQRVDGVLNEHLMNETRIVAALVLRLKLMANLDIAEKRLPQDGRFSLTVKNHLVDVRISTMPVQHGEAVVMRLLDQSAGVLDMETLGMPDSVRQSFVHCVKHPHGLVLVTGPTGSGKTTSLYSALKLLNQPSVKIITVEDPVEYRLPRINQVQVNPEIGLTFAKVLRTALRHDPDIVLVGEMRDQETMEIGLRAALTGHMVLSTLHTNDAVSTVSRLLDMGAPGYLLASALRGILAQRLIRRLCDSCKQPAEFDVQTQSWLKAKSIEPEGFVQSHGCSHCNNSGYKGRIGVYEFLDINRAMARALTQGDSMAFEVAAKADDSFVSLSKVALEDARNGITSLDEVMRVSMDEDEL